MASFLNNIEFDDVRMSPEQKLWRAVFVQAIQDTFGICTVGMSRDEHRAAKWFGRVYNQDFIELCEFAGFNPEQTFQKLKRYDLNKERNNLELHNKW
jgi:hypothetical protein